MIQRCANCRGAKEVLAVIPTNVTGYHAQVGLMNYRGCIECMVGSLAHELKMCEPFEFRVNDVDELCHRVIIAAINRRQQLVNLPLIVRFIQLASWPHP